MQKLPEKMHPFYNYCNFAAEQKCIPSIAAQNWHEQEGQRWQLFLQSYKTSMSKTRATLRILLWLPIIIITQVIIITL